MQSIKRFCERRPRLAAWIALAVAMLIVFFAASGGAAFRPVQRLLLAGVVVLLAGACVWIVYWE